jgi:hypothetical protein
VRDALGRDATIAGRLARHVKKELANIGYWVMPGFADKARLSGVARYWMSPLQGNAITNDDKSNAFMSGAEFSKPGQ